MKLALKYFITNQLRYNIHNFGNYSNIVIPVGIIIITTQFISMIQCINNATLESSLQQVLIQKIQNHEKFLIVWMEVQIQSDRLQIST